MTMATRPSKFVTRVRAEMDTQRLSMRGLARRIDPDNVERARRNLIRWMHGGVQPSRTNRHDVARALGIDPSEFEDDEESDPVADLYRALDRFIDHKLNIRSALLRPEPEMGGPGVESG